MVMLVGCGGAEVSSRPTGALRPLRVEIEEVTADSDTLAREESELVARDVAARRAGEHGSLPPVERSGEGEGTAWPGVTVRNDTPHGLVVWFAGPCARTLALPSHTDQTVELCAGRYDIAAQLAAPGYTPFVGSGDELEDGSTYRLTFYVVIAPQTRTIEATTGRRRR